MRAIHIILLVSAFCFQEIWTKAALSGVAVYEDKGKESDDGPVEMVDEQAD